jgi:ABC-type uncharacterized transport system substrate-binding protein
MPTCDWKIYDPQYCIQIEYKNENRIYEQIQSMRKRWKPRVIRNTRDSPEIINSSYRTISCNKQIKKWYNQNPKRQKGNPKREKRIV